MRQFGIALLTACATFAMIGAGPALADGPGDGTPTVVSVGDSVISGEAGRWAGNTNVFPAMVDALGPTAYFDNPSNTAETIPGCHRSKSAEIWIGGGVESANLACSGARTYTFTSGSDFKPGLDFYDDGAGHIGQAKALEQYAATHDVKMVVMAIGANDYGFGEIVQQCLSDWLLSPVIWPDYCSDDSSITPRFTASNQAAMTARLTQSLQNLSTAMRNAGYSDSQWKLLTQTYPWPLPTGGQIRYPETGYVRQIIGGCGLWNRDADWAYNTGDTVLNNTLMNAVAQAGLINVSTFVTGSALGGHRLCENTDGLLEEQGLPSWQSPGAADRSEWVSQIRTASTLFEPYQLQEDIHPNYWGQLALRNCLRQAYNDGAPRGGNCTPGGGGLNGQGEPNMSYAFG
jgi:hypothetical protein